MKFQMRQANLILGIMGVLGGLIIIWLAFVQNLAFTKQGFPGPGFFPIMCGIAIVLCSLAIFMKAWFKAKKDILQDQPDNMLQKNIFNRMELKSFAIVIGISWAVVILSDIIGLLVAISIAVVILIRVLGKETLKTSCLVGVGTFAVLFLIFDVFLRIPLPAGIFQL